MRRLPPLTSLLAFEAAARHGSFKRAAAELSVTPTAVSHQIRALERTIGLALFERRTRQVVLTESGAQLFPVLCRGLDAFDEVLARLTRRQQRAQVVISATIAFTAHWLVPRLSAFRAAHPDIDLQLRASDDVLESASIDLSVRYGRGRYPGFAVQQLFADAFAPVANPLLRASSAADLKRLPRIEFEWRRQHADNPTWSAWCAAAAVELDGPAQLRFSEESHAIQAAVAGQGVALLSVSLVADELSAGRLVEPFGPRIPGYGFYVLTRPGAADAVSTTARWLAVEARKSSAIAV